MHLLYHWRSEIYYSDLNEGLDYDLFQNSPAMLKTHRGDSVWAFTRRHDKVYVLAAELRVILVDRNVRGQPRGRYGIWGEKRTSRYFDVASGPDVGPLIRDHLSVRARAAVLGQSFQGPAAVRVITDADQAALQRFAAKIPLRQVGRR